jgi:hypothetical protein
MTIEELKEYMDERTRDMETTLLREFRKWAMRIEAQIKGDHVTLTTIQTRVSLLEERLDQLEAPNDQSERSS